MTDDYITEEPLLKPDQAPMSPTDERYVVQGNPPTVPMPNVNLQGAVAVASLSTGAPHIGARGPPQAYRANPALYRPNPVPPNRARVPLLDDYNGRLDEGILGAMSQAATLYIQNPGRRCGYNPCLCDPSEVKFDIHEGPLGAKVGTAVVTSQNEVMVNFLDGRTLQGQYLQRIPFCIGEAERGIEWAGGDAAMHKSLDGYCLRITQIASKCLPRPIGALICFPLTCAINCLCRPKVFREGLFGQDQQCRNNPATDMTEIRYKSGVFVSRLAPQYIVGCCGGLCGTQCFGAHYASMHTETPVTPNELKGIVHASHGIVLNCRSAVQGHEDENGLMDVRARIKYDGFCCFRSEELVDGTTVDAGLATVDERTAIEMLYRPSFDVRTPNAVDDRIVLGLGMLVGLDGARFFSHYGSLIGFMAHTNAGATRFGTRAPFLNPPQEVVIM